jgi:lipopolysaccharide biosynthesis regulator YciM
MNNTDEELKRLKKALQANEKLMQEAAIKYEDLIAAKEELTAALAAHKEVRAKNRAGI